MKIMYWVNVASPHTFRKTFGYTAVDANIVKNVSFCLWYFACFSSWKLFSIYTRFLVLWSRLVYNLLSYVLWFKKSYYSILFYFNYNVKFSEIRLDTGTDLFVNVPRVGDSERTFFGLRVKLPSVTTSLKVEGRKVEAIQLSAFPKDTTSELAGLSSHYPFLCWTSSREAVNTNLGY